MKKTRFIVIMALVAALFISASCRGGSGTPTPAPTATPTQTAAPAGTATPAPVTGSTEAAAGDFCFDTFMMPYLDPVRVTTARVFAPWMGLAPGENENNNWYTWTYLDHLGIELDTIWTAPSWGPDLDTMFNTALAANDLPDVMVTYTSLISRAISAGQTMEITDEMFNNWLSPHVRGIYKSDPVSLQVWNIDGRLMALPARVRPMGPSRNFWWFRSDWLEETGRSVPTSLTEVIDLARTFMAEKPTGSHPNPYGISMHSNLGTFTNLLPVFGVSKASWYLGPDGRMTFNRINPNVINAIQFFADLYAEGIIPEDFALMNDEMIDADRHSGRYGIWLEGTNFVATPRYTNWFIMNPEKHVLDYAVLTDFDGNAPWIIEPTGYGDSIIINANAPHPDAIFKIINLDADIISRNNKPVWIFDRSFDVSADGQSFNFWHRVTSISDPFENNPHVLANAFATRNRASLSALDDLETYDQMIDWVENGINGANWQETIYRYLLGRPGSTTMINYDMNVAKRDFEFTPWWAGDTPAMQENGNAWHQKFIELVTNAIINNTAQQAFDEFVTYFYNNGGQQAIDEANAWYSARR